MCVVCVCEWCEEKRREGISDEGVTGTCGDTYASREILAQRRMRQVRVMCCAIRQNVFMSVSK